MTRALAGGRALRFDRLIGVLAVTILTAACSPSAPQLGAGSKGAAAHAGAGAQAASSGTAAGSTPPRPREGDCRSLGYADITRLFDDNPTIPCSRPHTAYTFDVKQLPDDIAFTGVQIENDAVQNFGRNACRASFARFIGGDAADRALSRLTVTYFVPNQRHFDLGSHAVRCDVVAMESDSVLAQLPRDLHGVLDVESSRDRFAVCSSNEPGSPRFAVVMCTQDHAYRALAALRLGGGGAAYPGEQVTADDGRQRCESLLKDRLGAGGGYAYGWTYPSSSDWQAGQRYGYCWHKTAS